MSINGDMGLTILVQFSQLCPIKISSLVIVFIFYRYIEDSINWTPFVQSLVSHLHTNSLINCVLYGNVNWFHQDCPIYMKSHFYIPFHLSGPDCIYLAVCRLLIWKLRPRRITSTWKPCKPAMSRCIVAHHKIWLKNSQPSLKPSTTCCL